MVCAKCQKLSKGTTLATPRVKKKSEMYLGSPAASSSSSSKSATAGQTGVGKVRYFPFAFYLLPFWQVQVRSLGSHM